MKALIFQHPKGFFNLVCNEFFDRLSYYGLLSMLVIFVTQHFHFSEVKAYQLYGAFTTLAFLMPTIGGFLTDRFFNHATSVLLGLLFTIAANILLGMLTYQAIFIGLALLICGITLLKVNNASLLGFLYEKEDKREEGGFTILYMGMNLGGILGPIIYGLIAVNYGWHYSFLPSIIGTSFMAIFYFRNLKLFRQLEIARVSDKQSPNRIMLALIGSLILAVALYSLLIHLALFDYAAVILGLSILLILMVMILRQPRNELKKMLFLLVLNIFAIFYFACQNQVTSSLIMFISNYRTAGYLPQSFPVQAFVSLEPLFVILSAPIFAKVWQLALNKMNSKDLLILRVFLSLCVAAISFLLFKLAAIYGFTYFWVFMFGIIAGNLFLGLGELFIGPALMSAVTYLIDRKYQGTFMGLWSFSVAFSGFVGGLIAQLTATQMPALQTFTTFSSAFGKIALIMVAIIIIFLVGLPFLRRLVAEQPS